jgi:hypothetical protein
VPPPDAVSTMDVLLQSSTEVAGEIPIVGGAVLPVMTTLDAIVQPFDPVAVTI